MITTTTIPCLLTLAASSQPASSGSSNLVPWGIMLLAIAVVLFFMEIFVPSAGILGLTAAAAAVTGVVMLFMDNTTAGLLGLLATLLAIPILLGLGIKFWPHTPIGRRMTLGPGAEREAPPDADVPEEAQRERAEALSAGQTGRAVSDLRPVGNCMINGQRVECFSRSGVIPAGTTVRIVSIDGRTIRVREDDGADTPEEPDAAAAPTSQNG